MTSEWADEEDTCSYENMERLCYTNCVYDLEEEEEEEETDCEIPEEVCTMLDDIFRKLLEENRSYDETIYDLLLVWKEFPGIILDKWFATTSMSFKRYTLSILNGYPDEKYAITAADVHRLAHRRGFNDLPMLDVTYYPSDEEEEEDEDPVVVAEKGDWLKVDCTKGVYYFNEKTQESQWDVAGTPFEEDEKEEDSEANEAGLGSTLVYSAMEGTMTESELQEECVEGSPKRKHVTIQEVEDVCATTDAECAGEEEKRKKRRKRDPAKERERKKAQKKRRRSSRIVTQEELEEEEAAGHYIYDEDEDEDEDEELASSKVRRMSTPYTDDADALRLM